MTREEGGFFGRLAEGLAASGVASLRFDLRGHGESEGRQEDLTISSVLNEILTRAAHRMLAFADPGEPDNPGNWPALARINPHVIPSGVVRSDDPDERAVVLDQIRYLSAIGDYTASRTFDEIAVVEGAEDRVTNTVQRLPAGPRAACAQSCAASSPATGTTAAALPLRAGGRRPVRPRPTGERTRIAQARRQQARRRHAVT
ncbi:hypothetical protein [Dactylosporangium sp. CA-139066]|uniref:hypothetical protein n=1 Tax=Dactylosporangium sp. CA-139066 TaxID=3239930 RepID=UPI003D912C0C